MRATKPVLRNAMPVTFDFHLISTPLLFLKLKDAPQKITSQFYLQKENFHNRRNKETKSDTFYLVLKSWLSLQPHFKVYFIFKPSCILYLLSNVIPRATKPLS